MKEDLRIDTIPLHPVEAVQVRRPSSVEMG
jgi:hypothetical protein